MEEREMKSFVCHVKEEFNDKAYKTLNDELHRIAERIKMLEGPLASNADPKEVSRLRTRVGEIEEEIKRLNPHKWYERGRG